MLKKVFASFSCALLIFSASVLPCFASNGILTGEDTTVNTDGTLCTVQLWTSIIGNVGDFSAPTHTLYIADTGYDTNGTTLPIDPVMENLSSFVLEEDVTVYWRIAPFLYDNDGVSNVDTCNTANIKTLPKFYYGSGSTDPNYTDSPGATSTVQRLTIGNDVYGNNTCRAYRATLPATTPTGAITEDFRIEYPSGSSALWNTKATSGKSLMFTVDMFQIVETADPAILNVLDQILAQVETTNSHLTDANTNLNNINTNLTTANTNISKILTACNNILKQLKNLNADTDTIIASLGTLTTLSESQLTQLENISSSVDAIYYFLTEEMKSESDKLSGEASTVTGQIDNSAQAEEYYQTSMQSSYDSLNLDGFTFGGIGGAMEFVGTLFSDMWSAFGDYTILFTYPMILGIALLVIGRISKHGGGNSSRNAEHKGGEGGA